MGYFLTKPLAEIFEAGEQAKIPLLAGSNTQEQAARSVLGDDGPTPEALANVIKKFYGDKADSILKRVRCHNEGRGVRSRHAPRQRPLHLA